MENLELRIVNLGFGEKAFVLALGMSAIKIGG